MEERGGEVEGTEESEVGVGAVEGRGGRVRNG